MKLVIVDTETTDLDPKQGATILELAWMSVTKQNGGWKPERYSRQYVEYSGYINPHAQAVHHIRADCLTKEGGAHKRQDVVNFLLKELGEDSICVAHNADFDSGFLPEVTRPWICTRKSARHIWPEAPGHSNQVLRYWLGIRPDSEDILKVAPVVAHQFPHQALYDVATTTGILLKMLEKYTPDQLLHLTRTPNVLKTMPMGKYKGMEFKNVPKDYLQWLRNQSNLDADLKRTIDSVL